MSHSKIQDPRSKILFIVGPTASGKSGLAMRIAKEYGGEIICADSQTLRRGLDIGTAKPTKEDQEIVPHHMLDVIDPYERFSAAEFKNRAEKAIESILTRERLPIVVGGTGLYVDSLLYDFSFRGDIDQETRAELEKLSVEELNSLIHQRGLIQPSNSSNSRHLIRTLESGGVTGSRKAIRKDAVIVGIDPGKEVLEARIEARVEVMLREGFTNDVDRVIARYGLPPKEFDAIGYRIALNHRDDSGEYDIEGIKQAFLIADRQYAKRQRTWFKRNEHIQWFEHADSAYEYIKSLL